MAFRVVYSAKVSKQLEEILGYTMEEYGFLQVRKLHASILDTLNMIRIFPFSYGKIEDLGLKSYHKATIRKYHLIIIYKVKGKVVYIESIYHMRQDYVGKIE